MGRRKKVDINSPCHITKMVASPIYEIYGNQRTNCDANAHLTAVPNINKTERFRSN